MQNPNVIMPHGFAIGINFDGANMICSLSKLDESDSLRRTGQQSRALGDRETFHFLAIQRTVTGSVEIHADWTDVFLITDGHGQLRHSGRASNGRATAPGEYRGGTMQGGRSQSLGVGDVVVIPAGTAHQIVLAAGQRIGYLTFKLRAPRMPLPVRSTPP